MESSSPSPKCRLKRPTSELFGEIKAISGLDFDLLLVEYLGGIMDLTGVSPLASVVI